MAKYLSQIRSEVGIDEGRSPPRKNMFINQPSLLHKLGQVASGHVHHGHIHTCVKCAHLGDKGNDHVAEWKKSAGLKEEVDSEFDAELDAIYDGEVLAEEHNGDDEHKAHELVLHGDNTSHLYHNSHEPIMHNLAKKHAKGVYDHTKAHKLWQYHADRVAQDYHKEHGGEHEHQKWHEHFPVHVRKAAAHHWADSNHEEIKERGEKIKADRAAKGKKKAVAEEAIGESRVWRNPFAREEVHATREYAAGEGHKHTCDNCGSEKRTKPSVGHPQGKKYQYKFHTESDGGRKSEHTGKFCSKGCHDSYHGVE